MKQGLTKLGLFAKALVLLGVLTVVSSVSADTYTGTLRVYVAEPECTRWQDDLGRDYHNAFLDFALVKDLSVPDASVWDTTVYWSAAAAGFSDVTEDNLTVIAAVFNPVGHEEDFIPPYGYMGTAYDAAAAAAAYPGESGRNETASGFTHSVFIEEGTATWCHNCPHASDALDDISGSGDYPMWYVALVKDVNTAALHRLWDYYFTVDGLPVPIAMFDGGFVHKAGVDEASGGDTEVAYRSLIETAGARAVPPVDVGLSVEYLGGGEVRVKIGVSNGAELGPASPAAPSGPAAFSPGRDKNFYIDVQGEGDLYYQLDWGDGNQSEWLGPYQSGQSCIAAYDWRATGTYEVRCRVDDGGCCPSAWSDPFTVNLQCCIGTMGNLDGIGEVDGVDLSIMLDLLFISLEPLVCWSTADLDYSGAPDPGFYDIDGIDLSIFLQHMFITLEPFPACP